MKMDIKVGDEVRLCGDGALAVGWPTCFPQHAPGAIGTVVEISSAGNYGVLVGGADLYYAPESVESLRVRHVESAAGALFSAVGLFSPAYMVHDGRSWWDTTFPTEEAARQYIEENQISGEFRVAPVGEGCTIRSSFTAEFA